MIEDGTGQDERRQLKDGGLPVDGDGVEETARGQPAADAQRCSPMGGELLVRLVVAGDRLTDECGHEEETKQDRHAVVTHEPSNRRRHRRPSRVGDLSRTHLRTRLRAGSASVKRSPNARAQRSRSATCVDSSRRSLSTSTISTTVKPAADRHRTHGPHGEPPTGQPGARPRAALLEQGPPSSAHFLQPHQRSRHSAKRRSRTASASASLRQLRPHEDLHNAWVPVSRCGRDPRRLAESLIEGVQAIRSGCAAAASRSSSISARTSRPRRGTRARTAMSAPTTDTAVAKTRPGR